MDVVEELKRAWPAVAERSMTVVLGVSGGADSVALLRAVNEARGRNGVVVGHFNHGTRQGASDRDEDFVRGLCQQLADHMITGRMPENECGVDGQLQEEAARARRHEFLLETARKYGARYIALAHTQDDQIETILHRIIRGTGITGLSGMRSYRPLDHAVTLIHPLLGVSRDSIESYLRQLQQTFRNDESNSSSEFTRNRIRHELLPRLRASFNPKVGEALLRLGEQANEVEEFVLSLANRCFDQHVHCKSTEVTIEEVERLIVEDSVVVRRMFALVWRRCRWPEQAMTAIHWAKLVGLVKGEPSAEQDSDERQLPPAINNAKLTLPGNVIAQKKGDAIHLHRL